MAMSRRDLLRAAGTAATAMAVAQLPLEVEAFGSAPMPKRPFGKTGWKASIYALGSAEIPNDAEATRAINRMIDGGVNYLDTAPSYQGTRSESVLGGILKTRRKEVFLATKTLRRDADGAYSEVRESLRRLHTERIDLLQIHAVNDMGTLDRVLAKGGAAEGLERARRDGLIRFIGITGHTRPEVILKAIQTYPFDAILIPVSALDASLNDFATEVVPAAVRRGIGVAGMKSLKGIERAVGAKFEPGEYLRYAFSLPISTLTIGLRRESEVDDNLQAAREFRPMTAAEKKELERASAQHADVGNLWWKRQ